MSVSRTVSEIFSVKKSHDLETGVRGCSRSLKMAPLDRSYTTFYWSTLVSIALCCTIFVNNRDFWNLGYRSLKVILTGTIRKLGCSFLFAFHSNYGSILHHFRDKVRYRSKIVIFSYILAFNTPVRTVPVPFEVFPSRLVSKTRMVGLPDGEKTLRICITV